MPYLCCQIQEVTLLVEDAFLPTVDPLISYMSITFEVSEGNTLFKHIKYVTFPLIEMEYMPSTSDRQDG